MINFIKVYKLKIFILKAVAYKINSIYFYVRIVLENQKCISLTTFEICTHLSLMSRVTFVTVDDESYIYFKSLLWSLTCNPFPGDSPTFPSSSLVTAKQTK